MMMTIEQLKAELPDFAKDIKLNMSNLFGNIASLGLTESQFYGTCLAVAFSLKNQVVVNAMLGEIHQAGLEALTPAAQTAATLMAMNNVYYRATHLAENKELATMPANLRMNGMLNPGVSKIDFELFALAVSAINGCGLCIQSHVAQLLQHDVTKITIQSALRIAATFHGFATALTMVEQTGEYV
jgi:alkyl hydroperoxide reductase subunit D